MSVTLKPYPEYKESDLPWLGEIPVHWPIFRIKNIFRETEQRSGDGMGTLLSLTRARGLLPQTEATNRIASAEDLSKYKVCKPGQLVMNRMQAWSGMFAVSKQDGLVSPDYTVFRVSAGVELEYFEHLFKTPLYVEQFAQRSKGIGSGFNRLYTPDFGAIPLVVPPREEQKSVVFFLSHMEHRINRLIRAKRRLIELLNEQKQAIIHQAVTRGLKPNVRLKPSGIDWLSGIPGHRTSVRLKHVSRVQTGITLGKNYMGQEVDERPYLRVANVQAGRLDLRTVKTVAVPPSEIKGSELQHGDVLMTEGGDIDKLGRGCVWRGEIEGCLHQNHIFAVRADQSRLLPDYLVALMASPHGRVYFQLTAKRTTNLASTNSSTLGAFPLVLPEISEQRQIMDSIASETQTLDAATDRAQRQIDLLREYRTRLIADVVTGKLDVRGLQLQAIDQSDIMETVDESEDEELEHTEDSGEALDAET